MTAVATAWDVESPTGDVLRVARERAGEVKITWLCGDVVTLDEDQVTEAIANLELLAPHGVWLQLHDQDDRDFVAKLVDGKLYAASEPHDLPGGSFSWPDVKGLLAPEPEPEPEEIQGTVFSLAGFRTWLRDRAGR